METIGDLPVRDISSYPKRGFPDILDAEQPDAVLFLSTETFAHRAFNLVLQVARHTDRESLSRAGPRPSSR